jgi:hypothetical protein
VCAGYNPGKANDFNGVHGVQGVESDFENRYTFPPSDGSRTGNTNAMDFSLCIISTLNTLNTLHS